MGMPAIEIERHIRDAFPDATIDLVDLAGDDNHFQISIASAQFAGKSRVEQHKMVYDALKGNMGGVLHALSIKTTPL